ncbi:hypothetical protein [Pseudomonas syringae]|nr:hypothetical protein [Pseudomonas syringae]
MSRAVAIKCQHLQNMVMAHAWAELANIEPGGYALARAYERRTRAACGSQNAERWAAELAGQRASPGHAAMLATFSVDLKALRELLLWEVLKSPSQTRANWLKQVGSRDPCCAKSIALTLAHPVQLLPTLPEPDHLTSLLILLKEIPSCSWLDSVSYRRGVINSLAKLSLEPGWYAARYVLQSLLQDQLPTDDPRYCGLVHDPTNADELDKLIAQYRTLQELGSGPPLFLTVSKSEWALFCAIVERATPLHRRALANALLQHHQTPRPLLGHPLLFELYTQMNALDRRAASALEQLERII